MADSPWQYALGSDGIGTLVLDVPGRSANTLSSAVLEALATALDSIEPSPPRALVIRSGKRNGFIAGADINEFKDLTSVDQALAMVHRGQRLLARIEALPCPTIALLQGFALGGGLELALSCRYRIAVDDGRLALGLPEVQLGIHPGFGGTVRAVRLLGVRAAMDLMLTGKTIRADRAQAIGLVDRRVSPDGVSEAISALLASHPAAHRPSLFERALSWPLIRPMLVPALRRQVAARVREDHYPAPYALLRLWARYGGRGAAAYEAEARSIAALFLTPTARNLVRVFQLQDRLKSQGSAQIAPAAAPLQRVHVIGAGVMGGDIAAWCALRGLDVTLQDQTAERIAPALKRSAELFDKRLREPGERAAASSRLRADVAGEGVATADLVIEAIFENLEAKRALFAQIEPQLKAGAILATNTSSLTLEALCGALQDPSRLIGLHFFNPVAQMPLVEVVHGPQSAAPTLAAAQAFVRRLDRLPLPCRSVPGFLVNRALAPYLREALIALEEGLSPDIIDRAARDYGMPMGPVELADVVGLDVCKHVGDTVAVSPERAPPVPLRRIEALIAAGKLGRKSGEGFYRWQDGKPQRVAVDPAQVPADLQDRLLLSLLNECAACLREGIVADADLVDAGLIFGAGFAPFRGGPLAWARELGPGEVHRRLSALAQAHGARFTADPLWLDPQGLLSGL